MEYDVIIVGGGPAGLSAALVLGRCRRRVLVCDSGNPRNLGVVQSWGFFTQDGTPPAELLRIGRQQVEPYGVEFREVEICHARQENGLFHLSTADGTVFSCRKLLLATGLVDKLPELEGVEQFYAKSVHHCPYCHGWEAQEKPLVAYGRGRSGFGLSLSLKTWSSDVTLCTDGLYRLSAEDRRVLRRNDVKLDTAKISRLVGTGSQLEAVEFKDGRRIPCHSLFFSTAVRQRSDLPAILGCRFNSRGIVATGSLQKTEIPGLFIAGDADRDAQQVVVAAAEGAKAALGINIELQLEDRK